MNKIEVIVSPDNSYEPFFWCLSSNIGDKWCNEGFGWESSIEKAWEVAYNFYKKPGMVGEE